MKEFLKTFSGTANKSQILIGLTGLLIGTLVYIVDRPPDQTYFVYCSPFNISLFKVLPIFFGTLGNNLPTFIHVFSFSLLTAGFISCQKRGSLIICMGWFLVDSAFELGQEYYSWALEIIPDWFAEIPFLENTKSYFVHGTFDYYDLAAITIGAVIAYFTLLATIKRRVPS